MSADGVSVSTSQDVGRKLILNAGAKLVPRTLARPNVLMVGVW